MVAMDAAPASGVVLDARGEPTFSHLTTDAEICAAIPYQLFCQFPALSPFYLHIEKTFSGDAVAALCYENLWLPVLVGVLYLAGIHYGKQYMSDRPAVSMQKMLAYWNLGLSIFSAIAVTRCVPHLLMYLFTRGPHFTVCETANQWYGNGVVGFWGFMFVVSKFPELVDTAFIVLRKRKLIFLHWYHHVTVLVLTFVGGSTKQSAALWFMSMNYSVHAVMYFYYFLSAVGIRVSWASAVTTIQIAQMFMGMLICAKIELTRQAGLPCSVTPLCHGFTCLIYTSYFYLFCRFAWFRFGPGKSKKPRVVKGDVEAGTAGSSGQATTLTRRAVVTRDTVVAAPATPTSTVEPTSPGAVVADGMDFSMAPHAGRLATKKRVD